MTLPKLLPISVSPFAAEELADELVTKIFPDPAPLPVPASGTKVLFRIVTFGVAWTRTYSRWKPSTEPEQAAPLALIELNLIPSSVAPAALDSTQTGSPSPVLQLRWPPLTPSWPRLPTFQVKFWPRT